MNPFYFYTFLTLYHIAFIAGYWLGINKKTTKNYPVNFINKNFVIALLIINIVMIILNTIRMGDVTGVHIIERLIDAIQSPSIGYSHKFSVNHENVYLGKLGTYILVSWGVFSYAVVPLGFYFYDVFGRASKSLFYFNIILTVLSALIIGTNKRIFDVVISTVMYWWLRNHSMKPQRPLRKYFVLLGSFLFIAVYFISSRGIGTYWNASFYKLGGIVSVNYDSVLLTYFPTFTHSALAIICAYLCQGYYALSLSTNVTLTPMIVLGSSLYLVDELGLNKYTYQYAIEQLYGWDSRVQWASIYTWIANDVSLYGVIVIMFIMGYILARLYKECIFSPSPVSFVLIIYMAITLVFIPCNFQILQDAVGVLGLLFFLFLWLLGKLRIKKHI